MPAISQVEALKRAKKIFDALKHSPEYPEYECKAIGDNWELLLSRGKQDRPQATLFWINNDGNTDTSSGIPVA